MTQSPTRKLLAIAICGLGTLSVTTAPVYADDDGSFWTQFVPSADTRLIFVSSEEGNDNNSGLNPNAPVKTLARGYELLRDGYPDWMLLKRGDVWYESFPNWSRSGRSESEKMVVGAYGDETNRPQIRPDGGATGLPGHGNDNASHVAFVGFHLEPNGRTADQRGTGIRWVKNSDNILFEDLYIDGFSNNVTLQAAGGEFSLRDLRLNGCVVVDAWSNTSHSQGLYASAVDGLTVENCVFDHNGWDPDNNASPTIFNHNIYLSSSNNNVIVKNNVISDASSHGIHFRAGGILINNLFLLNPISVDLGGGTRDSAREGGVDYVVKNNLIMYGRPIDNTSSGMRSWGISVKNTKSGMISGNILANAQATPYNVFALRLADPADGTLGVGFHDLTIKDNHFIGWPGPVQFFAPTQEQTYSNVFFKNNFVIRDLNTSDNPVNQLRWQPEGELTIENNAYFVANPTPTPFKHAGHDISFEQWSRDVEPSSSYIVIPRIDQLSIDHFMAYAGYEGSVHDYIDTIRTLSRTNPLYPLHAKQAYEWALEAARNME